MSKECDAPALRLTRIFPCSVERLWLAWSDWERTIEWWGPIDWPAAAMEADFREGGEWRAELRSEAGESLHQSGRFLRIEAGRRLAFTFKWDGDNHEDGPGVETQVCVEFSETPEGARMDFTQTSMASEESVRNHAHGWNSTFDRLGERIAETFE